MSELQSEDVTIDNDEYIEEVEQDEIAEDESPSDLAPDSDPGHEEKTESQINQDKVQEVINRKHWEAKESERKLLAAQKELEQYRAQQQAAPNVPDLPDPFDDDYGAKMQQRDQAMRQRLEWESRQRYEQTSQQARQQEAQERLNKELYEKQTKYVQRAKDSGITEQDLQAIGSAIANYGLRDDLVVEILDDKDGPLIAKHLAANPMKMEELSSLTPYQSARYIETLRPSLAALKPRITNAPNPSTKIEGKGKANRNKLESQYLEGGEFS